MGQGPGTLGAQLEERYFLQKVKLGEGSFGTVWRAVDRQGGGKTVAIKQLDKAKLPRRGVSRQDVEREVSMMRACPHENITRLFDTYEDSSSIYLALEYCDGGDFGDKVRERGGNIDDAEVAGWMRQMCSAIHALHLKGICHRDIKPDNFMVSGPATLKLADFGLAIFLPRGQVARERCGTPAFMAPELNRLPKRSAGYGLPVDAWAAGVSMFMVMCGGRHPFLSEGRLDEAALLSGQLDFRGRDAGLFGGPRLSEEARGLCRRLVEPDARRRASAEEALQSPWLRQAEAPLREAARLREQNDALQAELVARKRREELLLQQQRELQEQQQQLRRQRSRELQLQNEKIIRREIRLQKAEHEKRQLEQRPEPAPEGPGSPQATRGVLQRGARCRYQSGAYGWMEAVVQGYSEAGHAYDLDVRPQAALDRIAPSQSMAAADAWPPGTLAAYHSVSVNQWLPAVVASFNEADGTYNLDVRDHADPDRIRARSADAPGGQAGRQSNPEPAA